MYIPGPNVSTIAFKETSLRFFIESSMSFLTFLCFAGVEFSEELEKPTFLGWSCGKLVT